MKQFTEEHLLNASQDLIGIESTSDRPEKLQSACQYIGNLVVASGANVTIEEFESNGKPSLLAYRAGQRPDNFRIILNGHLDVVPGKPKQYEPVIKDGKLYGRGAYDMKAASVILAATFCEYVDKVPYPLGLQIVTDEENAGQDGTLYQIDQGVRADFVICGECGRNPGKYEIANEAKGIAALEIGLNGVAAHSAYPWEGENAALRAANFMHALNGHYPDPREVNHGTTVSITSLSAVSGAHSKIPDRATMTVVARYTADDPNFRSQEHFVDFLRQLDPGVEVLKVIDFTLPMYTETRNPLLLSLRDAAEKIEGVEFSFVRRHGTGDGRFYGEVGGEASEFGIVGNYAHGDGEYITLEGFGNYLATMRNFLEKTTTMEQAKPRSEAFSV